MLHRNKISRLEKQLIKETDNWSCVKWRGHQIWQNLFDLNVISEYILSRKPDIIIETGTWKGGSAIFFADMMKLSGNKPNIISIDNNPRATPTYDGVEYLKVKTSTDAGLKKILQKRTKDKIAFIILDSNHQGLHVYNELILYSQFIQIDFHILVQDGNLYKSMGHSYMETPLWGIERFLNKFNSFKVDETIGFYNITSHPNGWLKRIK